MPERLFLTIYMHVNLGGKFIIRIEDTDVKRNVAGGEESQLKYLKWLGMDWDESIDVGGGIRTVSPDRTLDHLSYLLAGTAGQRPCLPLLLYRRRIGTGA